MAGQPDWQHSQRLLQLLRQSHVPNGPQVEMGTSTDTAPWYCPDMEPPSLIHVPYAIVRRPDLVTSLIDAISSYLSPDHNLLDKHPPVTSSVLVDKADRALNVAKEAFEFQHITHEASVGACYSSAGTSLIYCLRCFEIGMPVNKYPARRAYNIEEDVEITLGTQAIIGEHKSPSVFDHQIPNILQLASNQLVLGFNQPLRQFRDEKSIIFKLAVSLSFHRCRYGFVHCMTKWLFFELHRPDPARQPVLFVSDVVNLDDQNTPVLEIIVAMMIAIHGLCFPAQPPPLPCTIPPIPQSRARSQKKPKAKTSAASNANNLRRSGRIERQKAEGSKRADLMLFEKEHSIIEFLFDVPEYDLRSGTLSALARPTDSEVDKLAPGPQASLQFNSFLSRGAHSTAYKAVIFPYEWSVVVKIAPRDLIFKEWEFYRGPLDTETLSNIPKCIGGYSLEGGTSAILILSDAGGTLRSFKDLDRAKKLELYRVVCNVHAVGVIHNDIRPPNIAIDLDGEIRLIDFGLAEMHVCTGPEGCRELIDLRGMLELGST